jgi:hypothetical protein
MSNLHGLQWWPDWPWHSEISKSHNSNLFGIVAFWSLKENINCIDLFEDF